MKQSSALKALLLAGMLILSLALPAAATSTAALSGLVFLDSNLDGQYAGNERLVDGAEVALAMVEGGSEKIVATALTGDDGAYQFSQLAPGEYYLRVSLPKGLVFGPYHPAGSVTLPAAGRTSRSLPFRLEGGSAEKHIGATNKSVYISAVAFGDENMNGGRFSSEPLIRDVLVEVLFDLDGQSHVIGSAATGKDGTARIDNLTPGTYRIAATMPEPYIIGPLGSKISAFYNVVNPSESNRGVSDPFTVSGSIGLGIGGVKSGTLKGSAWFDQNMNGVKDADESGASGLVLTLVNPELGVTRTYTADNQTEYEFSRLQAGDYVLTASLPEGQMFTVPGDSLFSDGYADKQELRQNVSEGLSAVIAPIGVMPSTSLEVIAFHDSNYNGLLDEGEPPFAGAEIAALEGGKALAGASTDAQGKALIPRVRGGNVTLRAKLPADQVFSVSGGEDGNAFSAVTAVSEITIEKTLPHGEKTTLYAGVTLPSAITGTLFEDNNTSGVFDEGEGMLSGFAVQAIDKDGRVAAEGKTNESGAYELSPLLPGDYKVRVLLQSPYIFSAPSQAGAGMENNIISQTPEYGQTDTVHVTPGQRAENINAGAFQSGVVNGQVLLGDERDGFGGAIGGLPGVLVELTDQNGVPVSDFTIATTDESGSFSLKGALPGTYKLRYTLPDHAKFSQPLQEETAWLTEPFAVAAGEVRAADPVFAVKTVIFSGQVFYDANFNSLEDEGDSRLAGAALRLDAQEGAQHEAMSDENGAFTLTGIRPGAYTLTVSLPKGFAVGSAENSPVPPAISGQSSQALDLAMGDVQDGKLIAAVKPLSIAGTAFYDSNMNGAFDPGSDAPYAAQAAIRHVATGAEYALTPAADGSFSLPAAFPGAYLVMAELPDDHLLTLPQGASHDAGHWQLEVTLTHENPQLNLGFVQHGAISGSVWNMDGSQAHVSGLAVSLMDAQGAIVASANTGADGSFAFDRLVPGSYTLSCVLPENYRFARSMDTASRPSLITSDSSPDAGDSSVIVLAMGEKKAGQDIGIGAMGKLGDVAWLDLNGNGMQDADEPGVPEIGIAVYQYNQLITQSTTDAYGRYLIDGLFPGLYTVVVSMPQELKPTIVQTQFPLVASVIVPSEGGTGRADNILVPSGGRNLNCDFGFVLTSPGRYPASMKQLPAKDWSPVVDVAPQR